MDELLLDLMICRIPSLKGNERIELQKKFDRVEDFSLLSKNDIEGILGRPLKTASRNIRQIRSMAEKDAERIIKKCIKNVSWREKNYPPLLREIYDPPAMLFYRGELPDPEKPLVAVVGTRQPTSLGAMRAFELGRELGEAGIPVVSGLALGIDAMAHRGNIRSGARTVAVLGSGPDEIYPSSNRELARHILEAGGLILSEYPPGEGPKKWNFPARNRIISGLARGTVVIEAPEKSGALITARFALDHDRDLWVDAACVNSIRGAGTAALAAEGAKTVSSAREILAEWGLKQHECRSAGENNGTALASSLAEFLSVKL
jgi:DNA processing protein